MKWNVFINCFFALWLFAITVAQISINLAYLDLFKTIANTDEAIVNRITGKIAEKKEQYGPPYEKMIENEPAFDTVYGPDDLVKSMRDHDKK